MLLKPPSLRDFIIAAQAKTPIYVYFILLGFAIVDLNKKKKKEEEEEKT